MKKAKMNPWLDRLTTNVSKSGHKSIPGKKR